METIPSPWGFPAKISSAPPAKREDPSSRTYLITRYLRRTVTDDGGPMAVKLLDARCRHVRRGCKCNPGSPVFCSHRLILTRLTENTDQWACTSIVELPLRGPGMGRVHHTTLNGLGGDCSSFPNSHRLIPDSVPRPNSPSSTEVPGQVHHTMFVQVVRVLSNRRLQCDIYDLQRLGTTIDNVNVPKPDLLASVRYSCVP